MAQTCPGALRLHKLQEVIWPQHAFKADGASVTHGIVAVAHANESAWRRSHGQDGHDRWRTGSKAADFCAQRAEKRTVL